MYALDLPHITILQTCRYIQRTFGCCLFDLAFLDHDGNVRETTIQSMQTTSQSILTPICLAAIRLCKPDVCRTDFMRNIAPVRVRVSTCGVLAALLVWSVSD